MKSTTARRVALSIVAATALTTAAACSSAEAPERGGDADGKADGRGAPHVRPVAALRSAETSTDRAESARVRSTTTIADVLSVKADGALGWGDGVTGTLTITYVGGTTADTMRALGTSSMEARYLPDAYYARMGDAFARRAGGRHWIRYAYADIAGTTGADLQDQMRNTTPNQSVKLLLASGDVHKVGEERIQGRASTHYSGTVDVADLATENGNLDDGQRAALKRQLDQAGVTAETIDIWVDAHDLLVKKTEKARTAKGLTTQTAYYSDYGVKVSAKRPPAADTQDFKALVKSRSGTS